MLAEKGVTDISLRELSDRVGLAKSNVLRYFDSREAIFLEVLFADYKLWLARLDAVLGKPRGRTPPGGKARYANEIRVAAAIADTLAGEPLLCELVGAMALLERNISTEGARDFKARAAATIQSLADLVARHLPWLAPDAVALFAEGALMLAAGMYPFSIPTDQVRRAMSEMGMPDPRRRFTEGLREGLVSWLVGASARS